MSAMHKPPTKLATEVTAGDELVERDGALLTVVAVARDGRAVVFTCRTLNTTRPITARVRATARVRVAGR